MRRSFLSALPPMVISCDSESLIDVLVDDDEVLNDQATLDSFKDDLADNLSAILTYRKFRLYGLQR